MRIVFLVQQLSQPRCIKRIESFQRAGFDITVYGFDNGFYTENLTSISFEIKERFITNFKKSRIVRYFNGKGKILTTIRKENNSDTIFYCFGFSFGQLCSIYPNVKFIYEEADVDAVKTSNKLIRAFLIWLDKWIINKSMMTVFTSEGFADFLFGVQYPHKVFIHPNKLSSFFLNHQRSLERTSKLNPNHIRFGFIGLIRYPNTILRFAKVVGEQFPQHEFHIWGQPSCNEFTPFIERGFPNITYHGTFISPYDLEKIYNQIDISIACYDTTSYNVRIAEPNKLYESIYFNSPIVVSENTFLAKQVRKFKTGFVVDASADDNIVKFIKSINLKDCQQIVHNSRLISTDSLLDNTDLLIEMFKNLINS